MWMQVFVRAHTVIDRGGYVPFSGAEDSSLMTLPGLRVAWTVIRFLSSLCWSPSAVLQTYHNPRIHKRQPTSLLCIEDLFIFVKG